ncbi:MAG TPA: hypothetical protein PKA41_13710 [Verrucomicrobiota bacterium]|nr:hypothetical protein [Verrucomicrobiota bacterium]
MRTVCIVVASVGVALLCGCDKDDTSSETLPPLTPADAAKMPGPPTVADRPLKQSAPVNPADGSVDMGELNRCLLRWVVANRRKPADFEEFAASAGTQIPAPPAGKKYVLTREMRIVLENR